MKIYQLPIEMVNALRSWFHPKDRSIILAPSTFIEGEEITTPLRPTAPSNPAHNHGLLYWKNGCWTQLDEFGNEHSFCFGDWTDWSPTVTQGVLVAVNTNEAKWTASRGLVMLTVELTVTGAGTIGSGIVIGGIPTVIQAANASLATIGTFVVFDVSTTRYEGAVITITATTLSFQAHNNTAIVGVTPSFGLAVGDIITFNAMYRRA